MVAQTDKPPAEEKTFNLKVSVDEVVFTFHAADAQGLPVGDLKPNEITVFDNEKASGRIVDLQLLKDSAIHAGILLDTSASMRRDLPANRAISAQYAQALLRESTDQAFVMSFGRLWSMQQPWTNDRSALTAGLQRVASGSESRVAGTAIFDNVAHTCRTQFRQSGSKAAANVVLLFSDGDDNASYQSLEQAVDACQHANVTLFAFRPDAESDPVGTEHLAQLTHQTGGRVFHTSQSQSEVATDLRIIEADMRNQYRLLFHPTILKHDGSFHPIALLMPDRVATFDVRSGYYAPSR